MGTCATPSSIRSSWAIIDAHPRFRSMRGDVTWHVPELATPRMEDAPVERTSSDGIEGSCAWPTRHPMKCGEAIAATDHPPVAWSQVLCSRSSVRHASGLRDKSRARRIADSGTVCCHPGGAPWPRERSASRVLRINSWRQATLSAWGGGRRVRCRCRPRADGVTILAMECHAAR